MEPVYAGLEDHPLALLADGLIDILARLADHLFNSSRVHAPVRDQTRQRILCDLTTHRIEGRNGNGLRRVVDDEIATGGRFQGANITPFAADNPPLHIVARNRDR